MPSPAKGLGECVFIPAGLFTARRCSSSKMRHGGTPPSKQISPEMPRAFPDHPKPEQQVGDGMRGNGVAQALFPANQSLVGKPAKDARQPFVMAEAKDHGGCQK